MALLPLLLAGCVATGGGASPAAGPPAAGAGSHGSDMDTAAAAGDLGPGSTPPRSASTGLPSRGPFLRVGLAIDRDSVRVAARGGLRTRDLATGRDVEPVGDAVRVRRGDDGLAVIENPGRPEAPGAGAPRADSPGGRAGRQDLLLESRDTTGTVWIDGAEYRGGAEILALPGHGLVIIDRVRIEDYLRGVVPLEMGPRSPDEDAAVWAQAVAARTYALANLDRRDSLGFDVFGSVEDQVYGGVASERPEATRAVRATRGRVLTWESRPIRAYYHADGGGRTARVDEVWNLPDAPYLRSVRDTAPDGHDWGVADPHHRWEARWTDAELTAALARGLASYYGTTSGESREVTGVRVLGRTASGRVAALEVRTVGGRYIFDRNDIRFALRRPDGSVIPSTLFDVARTPEATGGGLVLEGRGNGHGIGMCQWGAIGRARAGQSYEEILEAYYPGTELRTAY